MLTYFSERQQDELLLYMMLAVQQCVCGMSFSVDYAYYYVPKHKVHVD